MRRRVLTIDCRTARTITGGPSGTSRAEAMVAGADACLAKPFDVDAPVATVHRLLSYAPRPDRRLRA